jgi:hypothetical protein
VRRREFIRGLARRLKDTRQSSRLLSLAAVRDGMSRAAAARIGGMDRQTLRDRVHRFNEAGPDGLRDSWSSAPGRGSHPNNSLRWQRLSRPVPILPSTASCAGGASISRSSLLEAPPGAEACYVLAHGAGAGMSQSFLDAISRAMGRESAVRVCLATPMTCILPAPDSLGVAKPNDPGALYPAWLAV